MGHYRRPNISGGTIFFTVCLANRRSRLLTDQIETLRQAVREVRADHPFAIEAWVVMPNHIQSIWTLPQDDRAYGLRWGAIKAKFTRSLRAMGVVSPTRLDTAASGTAGVWQPRFWEHHLRDEQAFHACRAYCWHRPVALGLAATAHDWPYSSIHRDAPRAKLAGQAG